MSSSNEPALNIDAIERELTALWQQASEEEEHGGVIRASTLNLLVYVSSQAEEARVDDALTDITAAHPCRAILIVADSEAPGETLIAQVTSRCTLLTASSKQVCCEQVTITAGGTQADEVPSAATPLLLSDLSVYLWWRAVPKFTNNALFGRLAELSDRVIIDSADFGDPYGDLASMAAVLCDTPRLTAISDLNWARLTAWRSLLAGFYDVRDYRGALDQVDKVTIEYAPTSTDPPAISTRALLLGGWLASRLRWRVQAVAAKHTAESTTFELVVEDRKIGMEFTRAGREMEPGHLAMVTLRSAKDDSVSFTVRRSADAKRIETSVARGEEMRVQRVLSYETLSESELVGKELEILGHDRVYEQAVLAAAEMINTIRGN